MEHHIESRSARKIILAGASLALYWAASLIIVSSYALAVHQGSIFEPVAGFVGLAGALVLFGLLPRAFASRTGGIAVRTLSIAAPALFGIVVILAEACISMPTPVSVIARVVLSAALGCILVHMGAFLAHCDRFPAALIATASFFAGVLIYLSVSGLGIHVSATASALLTCASGITFVLAGFREHDVVHGASKQERELSPLSLPKGFWPLAIGLFLYSLVYGIVIVLTLATGSGFAHTTPVALSLLSPGLIFFVLLTRFKSSFDFRHFQWFLFVPSVIALLPLPFVDMHTGLLLCGILIMVFSFYDLASFILLVDLARNREPALVMRVFAWGRAANVVGISAGWVIAKSSFDEAVGQSSDGFILAAYFAVAVLVVLMTFFGNTSFAPLRHAAGNAPGEGGQPDDPNALDAPAVLSLDEKCDIVAERFGLSSRETEVFKLLAHGRSTPRIAETLCVSQSTVKTHSYRIFRKLDVHSQQEVIDLAESAQ